MRSRGRRGTAIVLAMVLAATSSPARRSPRTYQPPRPAQRRTTSTSPSTCPGTESCESPPPIPPTRLASIAPRRISTAVLPFRSSFQLGQEDGSSAEFKQSGHGASEEHYVEELGTEQGISEPVSECPRGFSDGGLSSLVFRLTRKSGYQRNVSANRLTVVFSEVSGSVTVRPLLRAPSQHSRFASHRPPRQCRDCRSSQFRGHLRCAGRRERVLAGGDRRAGGRHPDLDQRRQLRLFRHPQVRGLPRPVTHPLHHRRDAISSRRSSRPPASRTTMTTSPRIGPMRASMSHRRSSRTRSARGRREPVHHLHHQQRDRDARRGGLYGKTRHGHWIARGRAEGAGCVRVGRDRNDADLRFLQPGADVDDSRRPFPRGHRCEPPPSRGDSLDLLESRQEYGRSGGLLRLADPRAARSRRYEDDAHLWRHRRCRDGDRWLVAGADEEHAGRGRRGGGGADRSSRRDPPQDPRHVESPPRFSTGSKTATCASCSSQSRGSEDLRREPP